MNFDNKIIMPSYLSHKVMKPIRKKKDYLILICEVASYLLSYVDVSREEKDFIHVLKDDKTTRLIFHSKDKVFSVSFPFFLYLYDGGISFKYDDFEVDIMMISYMKSIFLDDDFDVFDVSDISILADEYEGNVYHLKRVLTTMILFEEGYFRFDHDPDSENGRVHPLNHFDFFYSNSSTFKIGSHVMPSHKFVLEMIGYKNEKKYLEK